VEVDLIARYLDSLIGGNEGAGKTRRSGIGGLPTQPREAGDR
jgi:hypothetical protein